MTLHLLRGDLQALLKKSGLHHAGVYGVVEVVPPEFGLGDLKYLRQYGVLKVFLCTCRGGVEGLVPSGEFADTVNQILIGL